MRRRQFLGLFVGATASCAFAAHAQERKRRIGVLMSTAEADSESSARFGAFVRGLRQLDLIDRRNIQIDVRWTGGDPMLDRKYSAELVALAPDVLLATASPTVAALQAETRTIPIVFAHAVDPVGAGFVDSLARPGGNATGFVLFEYGIGAKWLELLKELAPGVNRVAVLRDPSNAAGMGQFGAIQSVSPSFGVEVSPINVRDPAEIERGITALAGSSNRGLIVTAAPLATLHRDIIVALAARNKLPAVYSSRFFTTAGGLAYYGPDITAQYVRAAGYIARILKGEKAADLAVQAPTKYELAINLKTAKALGITVPPTVLARADEVIE
jgi:putative ABC transport system substrate-binding protein